MSPAKQGFSRAKIYATDTSFATWAFAQANVNIPTDRRRFGQIFENYVVNQIVASNEWANNHSSLHYWRQAGRNPKEVDVVAINGRNESIAIEIKLRTSIKEDDIKGLEALRLSNKFKRGFVIYCGNVVREIAPSIWAMPITKLLLHQG